MTGVTRHSVDIDNPKSLTARRTARALLMLWCCASGWLWQAIAGAAAQQPGLDPTQSITYWKPYIVAATGDASVMQAQEIFHTLLRSWDRTRVEPQLYVVDTKGGPWAASLADGNILISQTALQTCARFGKQRAEHLIAFVLAHELAHQRADDLWHQKFLRLAQQQSAEVRQQLFRGLKLDTESISDLAQREAQADHDGLIMMSSVGYDPYQITGDKDFFTAWVEQIWQNSCATANAQQPQQEACAQAQTRALRTRSQLAQVATQTSLYQLGIQAFIARDYDAAQRYFQAFGKNYPSRAVFTSMGLTQLAQALEIYQHINPLRQQPQPDFYYPLLLDTSPEATPITQQSVRNNKRSATQQYIAAEQRKMHRYLQQAIGDFQRALQIEPRHPKSYLLLTASYLLDGNTFMARGILQGQYIPAFHDNAQTQLLLAMISAIEGNTSQAQQQFDKLIDHLSRASTNNTADDSLLLYSSFHNAAAFARQQQDNSKAEQLWQQLAHISKSRGDSLIFRLALAQLKQQRLATAPINITPQVQQKRIGDIITPKSSNSQTETHALWLDGEQLHLLQNSNGAVFVTNKDNRIIGAWQTAVDHARLGPLTVGEPLDRPYKLFGLPSRHVHMDSGTYLAYDHLGIAIQLLNNKVSGWFVYQPR